MVLNHGSVSFGRSAAESLSWGKKALTKLRAPGLVTQKKAFFEEYYKRSRHLKAQERLHQTGATMEENNNNQADELPPAMSADLVANAPQQKRMVQGSGKSNR
ncbi:TPX2 (targeting protein for Xklp2) protein family [Zea mays]|uniref:TPX2 (Targeting protein for Xklp2) protein family n=1 Tax=Zea mays TaxID=4577 RepID=K7TJ19_MAIZE|nr:TPX2 (targeting protein for Xklp2) protein family [Zea mays]